MRQKAESLIKIWTKFLDMVTKRQIEKTTVYQLFSLFIQFSTIEISLFSRKTYDKLITMTGKKGGVPMLVGEL